MKQRRLALIRTEHASQVYGTSSPFMNESKDDFISFLFFVSIPMVLKCSYDSDTFKQLLHFI